MPTRAKKAAAKPAASSDVEAIIGRHDLNPVRVKVADLKFLPENPNVGGSEEAIKASLEHLGMYRPLIVQKSTMTLVSGNHTAEQLIEKGATEIPVTLLDITDEEAAAMAAGENRISRLSTMDPEFEAKLLKKAGGWQGTGFSQADYEMMVGAQQELLAAAREVVQVDTPLAAIREAMADFQPPEADNRVTASKGTIDDDFEDDGKVNDKDVLDEMPDPLEEAESELPGVHALKEDMIFPSGHPFGYPPLRPEMLVTELPDKLLTWVRHHKDISDPDQWWWYNYHAESLSGMLQDKKQIIIGSYTYDYNFSCFWDDPAMWTAKLMNTGITMAAVPDFSVIGDDPLILNYWALYRAKYVARYWQEAGIKVIPNLTWGPRQEGMKEALDLVKNHLLYGIPTPCPVATVQLQTDVEWMKQDPARMQIHAACLKLCVDTLQVGTLLVYGNKQAHEWAASLNLGCTIRPLMSRSVHLSEFYKARMKAKALKDDGI